MFSQTSKKDKEVIQEIDSYFSRRFRPDQPGCAVLIAKRGKVLYERAIGIANMESGAPIEHNTVFQIGSVTKLFTAIAVLQLIDQRKLALSDSIQKFIPTFPFKGHKITVEHLLTHSSGIPDYMVMNHSDPQIAAKEFTPLELIDIFKNEPLEFEPGTKSEYTNSGYFLLGEIIEVASGIPYGRYIEEHIFKPAGMVHSYYGDNSKTIPNLAVSYQKEDSVFKAGAYRSMSIAYSAGALLSTVGDLYLWNKALLNRRLLGPELLLKSMTPYELVGGAPSVFGYGWFVNHVQLNGRPNVAHSGGISSFHSFVMYLPKDEVFIVALSNLGSADLQDLVSNLALSTIGVGIANETQLDSRTLDSYTGKYQMDLNPARVAIIHKIDQKLIVEIVNEWKTELSATSESVFNVKNIKPPATLEFLRDEKGKVIKFAIRQGGLYEWTRVE